MVFVAFIAFVGYTYVVVTKKFDSAVRWDLPSRVYSDATALVPGMQYPKTLLEPKLNHVGYREVKKRVENPGEYRYVGDDLEIFLNTFEYPDMEFHAMPVVVDFEVDGIRSGNVTYGHRFHAPDAITVRRFDDYASKLMAAKVVLDAELSGRFRLHLVGGLVEQRLAGERRQLRDPARRRSWLVLDLDPAVLAGLAQTLAQQDMLPEDRTDALALYELIRTGLGAGALPAAHQGLHVQLALAWQGVARARPLLAAASPCWPLTTPSCAGGVSSS